ncbi:MAG: tRNA preQ1(34) S-adenosylmethionine ribosyltransferase-isomerase QueA [Candidatus Cloacimonetes bacterium]|nr:tRNA preQ1(34) S-adenosylmethionine ribosyltransferase-isomerase QueA [Candidatus Cloacimonadota bacterium]
MEPDLRNKAAYLYELPQELIAQYPVNRRSDSRLLVMQRSDGRIEHRIFHDIEEYLVRGDLLVLNRTRVIPARLQGRKTTGAQVEILLLNQLEDGVWECLVRPGKRLKTGSRILLSENFNAQVIDYAEEGARIIRFEYSGDFFSILEQFGKIPLPPYITRAATEKDKETYQTVYASQPGSVAAPTAGLHFTHELLKRLKIKGIELAEVDLNVGLGTFRPVKTADITQHVMHQEFCQITEGNAEIINRAKDEKRRVIAVGTTSTRTLESFAEEGRVKAGAHFTDIFIYPGGRKIQIIDGLLTNFHLPESTLLMLVSSFAGYHNTMKAYEQAVAERYRFFSYGDAMLII